MNEGDRLLSSTLSTSPLLFWAVNETETAWERKQTHSQSQVKGIKERRVLRSRTQAGNGAKWGRRSDDKGRAPVTTPCPKETALSSERREGCRHCCHFLGWEIMSRLTPEQALEALCKLLANSKCLTPHLHVKALARLSPPAWHSTWCRDKGMSWNLSWEPEEPVESSTGCHANKECEEGQKERGCVAGLEHSITPLTTPSENILPKSNDWEKQQPKVFEIKYCCAEQEFMV